MPEEPRDLTLGLVYMHIDKPNGSKLGQIQVPILKYCNFLKTWDSLDYPF